MSGGSPTREWFREWFGEEYLALYPHRNEEEAREAVALFRSVSSIAPGAPVLDLACGAGRHLRELRSAGIDASGLDLSGTLLRNARSASATDPLIRADMRRIPLASGAVDGLTSFFTSFGYFADPDDDLQVLAEMARVLSPGGSFMLDFLNAGRVRRDLVAEDQRTIGGRRVRQTREIEEGVVVKRILIEPVDGGHARDFEERVRLYAPDDLVSLLARVGLRTDHRFGDYRGAAFGEGSQRLILAGRLAAGRAG